MKKAARVEDVEALIREIQRYLVLMTALRKPRCPPEKEGEGRSTER